MKLSTFMKVALTQFVGVDGKPVRVEKNISGQWVLKQEFVVYGILDMNTGYSANFPFPLFNFYVCINLQLCGADPRWVTSATFGITPLGQRILNGISKPNVFTELLTHYPSYRAVTDITFYQEVLVKFKAYFLPDGRKLLVRDMEDVFDDDLAALRAILGKDYCRRKCPSELLTKFSEALEQNEGIRILMLDDYLIKNGKRTFKTVHEPSLAVNNQQLEQHIQSYFSKGAAAASISLSFNLCAAFALMQGCRLHLFKEFPSDATHPTPWMKHQRSYTESSSIDLTDVFILESLGGRSYWRLTGDVVPRS